MKHLAILLCLLGIGASHAESEKVVTDLTYEDLWEVTITDFSVKNATADEALAELGKKITQVRSDLAFNYVRPALLGEGENAAPRYTFKLEKISLFDALNLLNDLVGGGNRWKLERNTIVFTNVTCGLDVPVFFAIDYPKDWLGLGVSSSGTQFQDCTAPIEKLIKEIDGTFKPGDYEGAFYVSSRHLLFVHTTDNIQMLLKAVIEEKKEKEQSSRPASEFR